MQLNVSVSKRNVMEICMISVSTHLNEFDTIGLTRTRTHIIHTCKFLNLKIPVTYKTNGKDKGQHLSIVTS